MLCESGLFKAIGGTFSWTNSIFAEMNLQSQNALGQACLLVGPERVMRVEPQFAARIALDHWYRSSIELPSEAERVVQHSAWDAVQMFLTTEARLARFYSPVVRNYPIGTVSGRSMGLSRGERVLVVQAGEYRR